MRYILTKKNIHTSIKIFDSNEQGMKFLKIKIFEIDYKQFRAHRFECVKFVKIILKIFA